MCTNVIKVNLRLVKIVVLPASSCFFSTFGELFLLPSKSAKESVITSTVKKYVDSLSNRKRSQKQTDVIVAEWRIVSIDR